MIAAVMHSRSTWGAPLKGMAEAEVVQTAGGTGSQAGVWVSGPHPGGQ